MIDPRLRERTRISGLILAGGASSRFGEPKPLATLHGRPLVAWVASALSPHCDELLISVGIHDDEDAFRQAVPRARLVRDARDECGPIEGIRRGCLAAHGPVVLVAPSDAPFLCPSLHRALLGLLRDHDASIPRPAVMDPARAVYRRGAVLQVLRQEGDSVGSPSALVDRLDATFLEGEPLRRADPASASFIDVNRREDLERAVRAKLPVA